jgi:ABC-2 type transport system ATP-binding protein
MPDMIDTNSTAIRVYDLTKKFGDFTAVNKVSFQVRSGEIFGFLGPNGSGKTTTIRMMLGLLPPTSGEVEVLGVDMSQHPERIRPRVGYMSQRFTLYNDLSVMQNLRFYGRAYGLGEPRLG